MNERPFVVTFYSYKGGVGRTTLAINAAVALAKVGKTLLWDLDVEAPGLQHVTALRTAKPPRQGYFAPLLQWQKAGCPTDLDKVAFRAWDECLWSVQAEPRLSLLPAAIDASSQLGSYVQIDWVEHFAREPDKGLALIDALLAHWHESGFEFVVIDARTGVTDLGALLTAVVPDVTVLVGNFGVQNVSGLALAWRALQAATGELPKRVERGRGPLLRELVASPIPTVDSERRAAGYQIWEAHFGLRPSEWIEIPEDEQLRYSEKIGLLELPQDHQLNKAYRELARRLLDAREAQRDAARAEQHASMLYPETAIARGPGRLDAAERGRESQRRGRSFEEQVAHVLQMLRYSVERETLVDANRIGLIATTRGTLEDTTYFVECKDTQVSKDMVDKLANWVSEPQARARQARAMIVGRGFAPAALQKAKNLNVQCFTLAQLEARLFDFKPYLAQLRSAFEQSRLAECYVAQQVQRDAAGAQRESPEAAVELLPLALEWAAGQGKPLWVLLGDYGTGKTAFTQRFAYELARRAETDPSAPVPLLINLRDYPNATQLAGVIDEHLAKTVNERGRADAVLHLLARGRCVLLLDSFDEMGLAAVGVSVAEQFRQLALPTALDRDPDGGRVLITSREEFFRERVEAESVTRGSADRLARPGSMLERAARAFDAQIDTLPYFSRAQVAEYLAKRLGDHEGRAALARIDAIHGLADLATRPQLLDIVLEGLPELAQSGQVVNAGVLYHSYVSRWLTRHRPAGARLSVDEVRQLLEQLAEILWARGAAPLHYAQLAETVRGLQALFPARDPVHVDLELRTAAFLTRSPDGHYRFSHRSFLEFFYARRLLRLAQDGDESGFVAALAGAALRVEVVRFFADLWQGNGHSEPCNFSARLLALQQAPMAAANLLRLALWLGEHAAQSCKSESPDARAARREAWAAALPQPPQRAMLAGTDLSRMQLVDMPLAQAVFDGANLNRCDLRGAGLEGASLVGASAEDARFDGASCAGLSARKLRAIGSSWSGAQLRGADFRDACLRNSDWRKAEITSSVFAGADFSLARLESRHRPQLEGAMLAHASLVRGLARAPKPVPHYRPQWRELGMGEVNAVAYSPDGTRLASGGGDGTLRLWDAASGKELRRIAGHRGPVQSVAFSPDGTLLASGGHDGTLRLWDALSGQELRRFEGRRGAVWSVTYSPDGTRLVSGGADGAVRLWDAASGKELRRFYGHDGPVRSVAYSPDGTRLASGGDDGTLRLWGALSGQELRRFEGHGDWVRSVAFSPDGTRLASGGDDGTLRIWDAASGQELRRFEGHGGWVRSVAYSPDGTRLASGSDDGRLRLWDAVSGQELRRLEGHTRWAWSVAYSPDGTQLASGSGDGTLRLWDALSGKELRRFEGHGKWVRSVAFSPDGRRLVSGGDDGRPRLWDALSGQELRRFEGHGGPVWSVAYSPDGTQLASGSHDGTLRLWDAASGKELRRFEGHHDLVLSVAYSPDGTRLASLGSDDTLRLWDAASGQELRRFEGHGGSGLNLAYSPDGTRLADGGDDGTLRLWDVLSGQELRRLEGHGDLVWSMAFSPDGTRLASGSSDGTLQLWDAASGQELRRFEGHRGWVRSMAFSPDGTRLASAGDDGMLRLWDVASGQELRIVGHGGSVLSVAFASSGALAAAGHLITLFDAASLQARSEAEARIDWRWQTCVIDDAVTLYPDGRHAGRGVALEWLEYEELPEEGSDSAAQDPFPTLHRASDLPWLHIDHDADAEPVG